MRILVTGAAGFVGRAVAAELADQPAITAVRLLDQGPPVPPGDPRFTAVAMDLTAAGAAAAAVAGMDVVLHLASVPGGTAEADPAMSRRVNLDASLALLEAAEAADAGLRIVYASSIAVLGQPGGPVDDGTPAAPLLTYGVHKQMVELALADFQRRGRLQALALRLPGVVARPRQPNGLRSAFMSDVIHAGAADEPFVMPVSEGGTMWLCSARQAARNLVHAATMPMLDGRALTLPAVRATARDLVAASYRSAPQVRYEPDPAIERAFAAMPPLAAEAALALGFRPDASLADLVATARSTA